MRKLILIGVLIMGIVSTSCSQSSEVKEIKSTIIAFAQAGDKNDADALNNYLDDNFRVVMNQLFGSTEVSILSKSIYIDKIRKKEFGGDKRKLVFDTIMLNGNTASVKVTMKGSKMTLISLINLVKDKDGNWKIVSDLPIVG